MTICEKEKNKTCLTAKKKINTIKQMVKLSSVVYRLEKYKERDYFLSGKKFAQQNLNRILN